MHSIIMHLVLFFKFKTIPHDGIPWRAAWIPWILDATTTRLTWRVVSTRICGSRVQEECDEKGLEVGVKPLKKTIH